MVSIAARLKEELEARGEYVVLANTNWFAIFPGTLHDRLEGARRDGRDGPNLVVYRTRSDDERDHHVIPYDLIREFLVEETLSDSKAGGKRWNVVLDNGQLHVTHRRGKVGVGQFHRARLLVEDLAIPSEFTQPTADPKELESRVRRLRELLSLPRPVGQQVPSKRASGTRTIYARRPDVKAWVLLEAKGRCELCRQDAPFVGEDGKPYLEHHHVQQLADDGPDTVENSVALCPSCHRWLHHGADRLEQRDRLYEQVARLVRGDIQTTRSTRRSGTALATAAQQRIAPDEARRVASPERSGRVRRSVSPRGPVGGLRR